jgi:hypothetical protein
MGILHPQWAAETLEAGGRGAIMVPCPTGDCAYREGPQWVEERLKRRRTLRKSNIALLELAPGSRRELLAVWNEMISGQNSTIPNTAPIAPDRLPAPGSGPKSAWVVQLRRLTPGFMLLLLVFWVSLLLDQPASAALPQQAQLRLVINHSGKLMATANNLAPEVLAKLPKNIDPSMVLGGERFPIQIQLTVDGQPVLDQRYRPSGLRREGTSYGLEMWWLAPGVHQVKITLMDDGATWQTVFERQLDIVAGEAKILYYDPEQGVFVVRETP